jgi:hypothetical protein
MTKRRQAVVGFVVAGAALVSQPSNANPTASSVPLAPHGDAVDGTSGQPMALTPTSLLVQAEGADGNAGTSDDVTLLVTALGTVAPAATPIATPHGATFSSRIERLSATRAAMVSAGDDGNFGTTDDTLLVLNRLGSENVVIPVVIGGLGDNQQFTPERLASDRVVVPSLGTDLTADTADDEVVVVSVATDPPVVQRFAAPFQRNGGRTRVTALSTSAFLIASDGPNRKSSDADDLVYLFRADADVFLRSDLAAPGLNRRSPGRSVRLSTRYGLVVSAGPDYLDSTPDDRVLLLDAVEATVTPIDVPHAKNSSSAQPAVLAPDVAVVATRGPDAVDGTADDAVAILTSLGTDNAVSFVTVGATADNNACRPAALDATTFALMTFGADRTVSTSDDAITLVHDVGATPIVQHVVVGALANGTTSTVVPTSSGALLVAGGGTDGTLGTPDDAVVALTGIGGKLSISRIPIGGALDAIDEFRFVPQVLGGGRAAMLSSGVDDSLGSGGDDAVRVIDGLGLGPRLDVRKLEVRFARPRFDKSARVTVTATLRLESVDALTANDLTISVGNASQTLPAGSLVSLREGRTLHYGDSAGALGIIREFSFDTVKGTLRLVVRGADEDFATTAPSYVPVGIDVGGMLVPQSVSARPSRNGFVFRKKRARR